MSSSGNTTVPSLTEDVSSAAPRERLVRALAFIWNEPQPFRVGEVGLLDFTEHASLLLARTAHQDEGPASLVRFVRQEPGGSVPPGIGKKHQAECREAEQLVANLAPTPDQIRLALEKHGWHQVRTAEALGVDRYQLRRWMLKLDIRRP